MYRTTRYFFNNENFSFKMMVTFITSKFCFNCVYSLYRWAVQFTSHDISRRGILFFNSLNFTFSFSSVLLQSVCERCRLCSPHELACVGAIGRLRLGLLDSLLLRKYVSEFFGLLCAILRVRIGFWKFFWYFPCWSWFRIKEELKKKGCD